MIFQETWRMILDGTKTQTRRVVRPGEHPYVLNNEIVGVMMPQRSPLEKVYDRRIKWKVANGRIDWFTQAGVGWNSGSRGGGSGKVPTYAVQAGRGGKALFRIKIKAIRQEHLRDITQENAVAEGFQSVNAFVAAWSRLHNRKGERWADNPKVWCLTFDPVDGIADALLLNIIKHGIVP